MNGTATLEAELLEAGSHLIEEHGLPIIASKGKKVGFSKWGERPATVERLKLELADPKADGIGLIMGPKSGLIDFEVDNADEAALMSELFDGPPPVTVSFKSKHGQHWLFKFDERLHRIGNANKTIELNGKSMIIRIGVGPKPSSQSAIPPSPDKVWCPGCSFDDCDVAPLTESVTQWLLDNYSQED